MKSKKSLFLCFGAMLLLWSCYPDGPDYDSDLDVVYTNHSSSYDFSSKSTYSRPDKIVVDVDVKKGDTVYMDTKYATPILARIDNNMTALGWQKVALSDNPDVLLTPAAMKSTTIFYSYWYDWWYRGYYSPYWGWYYPPYVSVSSYTTGNLIMVISDPHMESPILSSPAIWVASTAGLISYGYDQSRISRGIDQAFKQSPYLKTN